MGNCLESAHAVAEEIPFSPGRWKVPHRITALFAEYDTNADGMLDLGEIQTGITGDIGNGQPLREHAAAAIPDLYAKGMEKMGTGTVGLNEYLFVKLYCSVLFKHFDADNSGFLNRPQAEAALAFLTTEGSPPVAIALPADVNGDVKVNAFWFWDMFKQLVR